MRLLLPQFPSVKGVFVGGCVERGEGSSFRARAHAHNQKKKTEFSGWICVRARHRVGRFTVSEVAVPVNDPSLGIEGEDLFDGEISKPSQLILHEVAHIETPGHGHDDKWREKARALGYRLPAQYQKQKRQYGRTIYTGICPNCGQDSTTGLGGAAGFLHIGYKQYRCGKCQKIFSAPPSNPGGAPKW